MTTESLTQRQAAETLGIHRSRVNNLIHQGWLCAVDGRVTAHSIEHYRRTRKTGRHRWPPTRDEQQAIVKVLTTIGITE